MTYLKNGGRMQDDNLVLHDGTSAITADALATVGGVAADGILDLGDTDVAFDVVFDASSFDTTTGDEEVFCQILGSDSSTFASGVVVLGELHLGDATALAGGTGGVDTDKGDGKHILTVRNRIGGDTYRYVRLNFEVAGTTPSVTFLSDIYVAQVRPC